MSEVMERQEMFTKAYLGLEAQGFKKCVGVDGACQFNDPNGLHCAVGHIVSVPQSMNEKNLTAIGHVFPELNISENFGFLNALQSAHDGADLPGCRGFAPTGSMQSRLVEFARIWDVQVPA